MRALPLSPRIALQKWTRAAVPSMNDSRVPWGGPTAAGPVPCAQVSPSVLFEQVRTHRRTGPTLKPALGLSAWLGSDGLSPYRAHGLSRPAGRPGPVGSRRRPRLCVCLLACLFGWFGSARRGLLRARARARAAVPAARRRYARKLKHRRAPTHGSAHALTAGPPRCSAPLACVRVLGSPRPHLHRDWAAHICAGTGLTPAHICTGTGLAPPTSAPGLGSPRRHRHRDWAHPLPHLYRDDDASGKARPPQLVPEYEPASTLAVRRNPPKSIGRAPPSFCTDVRCPALPRIASQPHLIVRACVRASQELWPSEESRQLYLQVRAKAAAAGKSRRGTPP